MYKYLYIIFALLLSSCVSMIGPDIETAWDCGIANSETRNGNCSIKSGSSSRFAKIFGAYSGPLKPIGYNQAAPHGWGKVMYNGKLTDVKFSYGIPREAIIKFDDGSTFRGEVHQYMNLKNGKQETNSYSYEGSFSLDGSHKRGTVTYKKTGNKFTGSYSTIEGAFYPKLGTLFLNGDECSIEFYGEYISDAKSKLSKLNKNKSFYITHPFAKISKTQSSTKVDFTLSSMKDIEISDAIFSDDNGYLVNNFKTATKVLNYNDLNGDISWSNLEWDNIKDCNSAPTISSDEVLLDGVINRVLITDTSIDYNNLIDYGFIRFSSAPKTTNQLLVLKYTDTNYDRKITRTYSETSKYISSKREVYNSAYDTASREVYDASDRLARAKAEDTRINSQPCAGDILGCAIARTLISDTSSAQKDYDAAVAKLERTPRTKIENIYSDYEVQKLDISANKSTNLKAIFINFDNGETYEINFPLIEKKNFIVINSPISETDTNRNRLTKNTSTEKEVDEWMNKSFRFKKNPLDLLVEIINIDNKLAITSLEEQFNYVDDVLNEDKKTSVATNNIKTSIKNSEEYEIEDSILVIDTLEGMGTGFYVRENFVISNQHVVDESSFVNLRDMTGNAFTGKVVATDISTDLALIKVSQNGIPLQFKEGCSVKRRENVFTVGHPKGYEYSTSRGIVSSIRNIENPFYKATGLKMYIQIDAPISSGNSGGPLFNADEKVIGVNTWSKTDGQNLNFAVHCSEVQNFINQNI